MKRRALLSFASIVAVGVMSTGVAGASSTPTQYFTVTASSPSATPTVVASGPISANGTDIVVRRHVDNFAFPDGTVSVRHEPLTTKQTYDRRTCVFTLAETGTYSISHGTGAYSHATGSGVYKVSVRGQGCDPSQPPTSFSLTIQAHGPLTL